MIYLQLFWAYLKIGIFGFGGGYAMLSMIQFEIVDHYGWMTVEEFADMVALSQMTPGPVSINIATYIGYTVGGIFGSLVATAAIVLPSLLRCWAWPRMLMLPPSKRHIGRKPSSIIRTKIRATRRRKKNSRRQRRLTKC